MIETHPLLATIPLNDASAIPIEETNRCRDFHLNQNRAQRIQYVTPIAMRVEPAFSSTDGLGQGQPFTIWTQAALLARDWLCRPSCSRLIPIVGVIRSIADSMRRASIQAVCVVDGTPFAGYLTFVHARTSTFAMGTPSRRVGAPSVLRGRCTMSSILPV